VKLNGPICSVCWSRILFVLLIPFSLRTSERREYNRRGLALDDQTYRPLGRVRYRFASWPRNKEHMYCLSRRVLVRWDPRSLRSYSSSWQCYVKIGYRPSRPMDCLLLLAKQTLRSRQIFEKWNCLFSFGALISPSTSALVMDNYIVECSAHSQDNLFQFSFSSELYLFSSLYFIILPLENK